MDSVEHYIKHNALHFYISDSVRHLAAVLPVETAASLAASTDRVVTPQSSSSVIPSTPPSVSGGGVAGGGAASSSGVYSPTSPPPAGPTIPTAVVGSASGSSSAGAGAGPNGSFSNLAGVINSVYSFDDMLTEIPQYFQDVLCGRNIAGLSAPWEYILCTKRNRVTFCLALHRTLTHILPSLILAPVAAGGAAGQKQQFSGQQYDVVAALLSTVAGIPLPLGWSCGEMEATDLQAMFVSMVQLHCSDMPRAWLYVILRRAAALYARQVSTSSSSSHATSSLTASTTLPLAPHAILHRMLLLHIHCKELVEDLQAAFPVGGGGASVDRCRSDLCTWRRTFERWGLDGSWRCGGHRSSAAAAAAPIVSVQPYIPVTIINSMFDSPSALREAVGSASSTTSVSTLSPDADALCALIVHSDEWFLWCTNGEMDEAVACSYT
ncbi:Hypothetical protein, putative [Bodo saltans]|uniref:Uncharacterized protein n=1 Tax=Bodo saltans TaxID=75058 RepID=A0A0S4IHJ6_BODSA|nr:Hypothetical protein, putative [Bodo saltans]|eukprot:CUE65737.1 Hypothetical protein, putative [Bodo saltans]